MDFELKDVLQAVGPNASLIFASWIFLSFLQQRYSSAYDRFRALAQEVREGASGGRSDERRSITEGQLRLYKRRCEQMRVATNVGIVAAMLLTLPILLGAIQVALPEAGVLRFVALGSTVLGLSLILVAAGYVMRENTLIQRAFDSETSDLHGEAKPARADRGKSAA